jgi:GDP-L-fucose synthase
VSGEPDPRFWEGRQVVVTGGTGFLGKVTAELLRDSLASVRALGSADFDLRDAAATRQAVEGADVVIHLAARVGGIGFNRRNPGPLAHDNLAMAINVFEACRLAGVGKLVGACSVCAYPKHSPIPFREDDIWDGYPEESNAPYGLAKRMMIVLSQAYRDQYGFDSCVPVIANLYGPGDNFDLEDSHVIAAMVRKYVEAAARGDERVTLWGTGRPTREFLHVDDAARALVLAAERLESSAPVNIGTGIETSIRELAEEIEQLSGFEGETVWDDSMPDGQMSRYLDVSRAREQFGYEARVPLSDGLAQTVEWFRATALIEPPSGTSAASS